MGGRGGGMLSPRGAGAGAWSGQPQSWGRTAPSLLKGEKAPEGQGCCEPWGPCLGNGTQQGGCPPDSPGHPWQHQESRPPWGAGHRGSWGTDPVPRALRPPPRREWRGCPAWRLRRRPVVALGDSGEARHRLTVSGVPGGTGARAPGVAGHTSPDVPSGPGPGFESQPHAPTWKAVGPPWAHLCLGGRQPSLPSGADRPAFSGSQEAPLPGGRWAGWARRVGGLWPLKTQGALGRLPTFLCSHQGRDSDSPLGFHF